MVGKNGKLNDMIEVSALWSIIHHLTIVFMFIRLVFEDTSFTMINVAKKILFTMVILFHQQLVQVSFHKKETRIFFILLWEI